MKTHPTLIVEGKDSSAKMEVTGHLPPGSGKHIPIIIHALRFVLVDLTDKQLDYLLDLGYTDKKKYKSKLIELLDTNPNTFTPQ